MRRHCRSPGRLGSSPANCRLTDSAPPTVSAPAAGQGTRMRLLSWIVKLLGIGHLTSRHEEEQGLPLYLTRLEDRQVLDAIAVTTTVDAVNGDPTSIATLVANPGSDGISLREAVVAANNTA